MEAREKIEYGPITVKLVWRDVWEATTQVTHPMNTEVNMKGKGEDIARQKLILFLEGKPYKHLDNM